MAITRPRFEKTHNHTSPLFFHPTYTLLPQNQHSNLNTLSPTFPVWLPCSHWPSTATTSQSVSSFQLHLGKGPCSTKWRMASFYHIFCLFSSLQSLDSFTYSIRTQSLHFLDILLHHLSTKWRQDVLDNLICASQVSVSVCLTFLLGLFGFTHLSPFLYVLCQNYFTCLIVCCMHFSMHRICVLGQVMNYFTWLASVFSVWKL